MFNSVPAVFRTIFVKIVKIISQLVLQEHVWVAILIAVLPVQQIISVQLALIHSLFHLIKRHAFNVMLKIVIAAPEIIFVDNVKMDIVWIMEVKEVHVISAVLATASRALGLINALFVIQDTFW
jgi:hypothetical protein